MQYPTQNNARINCYYSEGNVSAFAYVFGVVRPQAFDSLVYEI